MFSFLLIAAISLNQVSDVPRLVKRPKHVAEAEQKRHEVALAIAIDQLGQEHAKLSVLKQQRNGATGVYSLYLDFDIYDSEHRCREMERNVADIAIELDKMRLRFMGPIKPMGSGGAE
jgi:hypothetical protein